MRPNATQQRILVVMTAVLTFFGGFLLAPGQSAGFYGDLSSAGAGMAAGGGFKAGRQARALTAGREEMLWRTFSISISNYQDKEGAFYGE
jgi:hypothetical protein